MAYSYDFKDNTEYGAEDINAIRNAIVSAGVVPESASSCAVIHSGENLLVCEGQAIFADGSRIVIDAEGVTLAPISGSLNYVYLFNDAAANENNVKISATMPTGDYLLLAEFNTDGTITDKRNFSSIKQKSSEISAAPFQENVTFNSWKSAGETVAYMTLPIYNPSMVVFGRKDSGSQYNICMYFPIENVSIQSGIGLTNYKCPSILHMDIDGDEYIFTLEISGNQLIFKTADSYCKISGSKTSEIIGYCLR